MSTIVYYMTPDRKAYCEGPLSEMPPGSTQVPRRPDSDYDWNFDTEAWVLNVDRCYNKDVVTRNNLLKDTAWLIGSDSPLSAIDLTTTLQFRTDLINYSKSDVSSGIPFPTTPDCVTPWIN